MWNYVIPGISETVYNYALWFLFYSVLGWFVESIYMSACNKKLTNRGFIHGPICPIYGFGGTIVHTAVRSLAGHYMYMFIAGMVIATIFEFITAHIMIRTFGYVWWDYNNKPLNFRGIVCLESSIAWGAYTVIEHLVLYKLVFITIYNIPVNIGKIVIIGAITYYTVDFIYCIIKVKRGNISSDENNLMQYSA